MQAFSFFLLFIQFILALCTVSLHGEKISLQSLAEPVQAEEPLIMRPSDTTISKETKSECTFKPYGFIATDLYYDSRQVFGFRDDFFLLFPERFLPDRFGHDINAHPQWQLLAGQTRVGLEMTAPFFWQSPCKPCKTHESMIKGVIEGDFLGLSETFIGSYRMRHAYLLIDTHYWSLLAGQYWDPLFVPDCFPDTVSFNNGAPMEPQARQPQLRYTLKIYESTVKNSNQQNSSINTQSVYQPPQELHCTGGIINPDNIVTSCIDTHNTDTNNTDPNNTAPCETEQLKAEIILAALSQNPFFSSTGPIGDSTSYIRNAVVPNIHATVRFFPTSETVIGGSIDFKRIVPRLVTDKNIKTDESINSFIAQLYAAYNAKRIQIRGKLVFAQNATDQLMLSGYAVRSVDPITDFRTYSNTQQIAAWLDSAYWFDQETKSIGLFLGATKNLGSSDTLFVDPLTREPIVFAIEPHVAYVWRASPRMKFKKGPFLIGLELEITQAAYGMLNRKAEPVCTKAVTNFRFLAEVLYFF